ncbi:MAG: hypothetical protein AAGJ83_13945, partial [Planctomycetota bacterium]
MTAESDKTFERFEKEIVAAIRGRVPIRFGSRTPSVDGLAALRPSLRNSGSNAPLNESNLNRESAQYLAAFRVYERTGSMSSVLEGLSIGRRAEQQLARLLRVPFFYFLGLMLLAGIGLAFFVQAVQPSFEVLRGDLPKPPIISPPD